MSDLPLSPNQGVVQFIKDQFIEVTVAVLQFTSPWQTN